MTSNRAGLVGIWALLLVNMHAQPSEACGVKLGFKPTMPRKVVARTSNPSHVLLVGSPPRRLGHDLSAAGHAVETVPSPAAAKRSSYAVVIVDSNDQASEARTRYPEANVVVRSGDVGDDLRSVEDRVARHPLRADESRAVIKAREARTPIAVGHGRDPVRVAVAAKEPTETQGVTAAVAPPPPVTPPSSISELHQEIYFTTGSTSIGNKARLAKAVKWLTENADVHVVLEGHADPTGTPDANMALSQVRAETVRDYLVSNGVDQARIEVTPFGDTRLKYGRADARNRRVEIEAKK